MMNSTPKQVIVTLGILCTSLGSTFLYAAYENNRGIMGISILNRAIGALGFYSTGMPGTVLYELGMGGSLWFALWLNK
ncbi:hypothetical protein Trisim1_005980 [Trichoderma cf. simile WF8]